MIPTILINTKPNISLMIVLAVIILSLFSKRVRRIVVTSNIITFILVVLQKLGLGYYSDKIVRSTFEGIYKLNTLLNDKKDLASMILCFDSILYQSLFVNLNQLVADIKSFALSIDLSIKNIAFNLKTRLDTLKNETCRRVNLSKLTLNYRI